MKKWGFIWQAYAAFHERNGRMPLSSVLNIVCTGKTWCKTIVLFFPPRSQAYICSLPWHEVDWILRLFRAIRKFVYRGISGSSGGGRVVSFFVFFFSQNPVFQSFAHQSTSVAVFLQIVAPRYRIGNFRNLSCPSNDLSPAHRPFDTANALDRSMHSTSLRSIDTSDTLHRDV